MQYNFRSFKREKNLVWKTILSKEIDEFIVSVLQIHLYVYSIL